MKITNKTNSSNANALFESNQIIAEFMGYEFNGIEFDIPEHTTLVQFVHVNNTKEILCFRTSLFKVSDLQFP